MERALDHERLERLLEAGRGLLADLDLGLVLDRLLKLARELTGARYAALIAGPRAEGRAVAPVHLLMDGPHIDPPRLTRKDLMTRVRSPTCSMSPARRCVVGGAAGGSFQVGTTWEPRDGA
jgi:hypothetical protein